MIDLNPDLSRKLYTITIDVYPNAHIFDVTRVEEDYQITYQQLIGVLEIIKAAYLREHGAKVASARDAQGGEGAARNEPVPPFSANETPAAPGPHSDVDAPKEKEENQGQ